MAKVRPTYLVLRNFRSFAGAPVRIDFPENGLVSIEGLSGSGKSNILKALSFGLGYEQTPSTKLRTWLNEQPWGVEIGLDFGGLAVSRVLGSKTSLKVEGEPEMTSASAISDRMRQLLGGLEPEVLRAMTYRQQQRQGTFLSQPDSKKRSFLIRVVPALGRFDLEHEASGKNYAAIEKKRSEWAARRDAYAAALGERPQTPSDLSGLDAQIAEALSKTLSIEHRVLKLSTMLKGQVESEMVGGDDAARPHEEAAARLLRELESVPLVVVGDQEQLHEARLALAACKEKLREERKKDDFNRTRVEGERRVLFERMEACKEAGRKADAAEVELSNMRHDLLHLSGSKCPRCGQQWQEAREEADQLEKVFIPGLESAIEAERELEAQLSSLERSLDGCVHATPPSLALLVSQQEELATKVAVEESKLSSTIKVLEAERGRRIAVLNEGAVRERALAGEARRAFLDDPNNLSKAMESDLEALKVDLRKSESELAKIRSDRALAEANNRSLLEKLRDWESRRQLLIEAERSLDGADVSLSAEKDYGELVKSFVGAAFEGVLEEVAQEANRALARVENTQSVSISFETEKSTSDGEMVSKIVPVVSVRGHDAGPSDLSGGMGTMLDLAVDLLGVGEVASRRSGFDPGWVILDESFDGMGARDREGCMEILRQHAEKKLILVVTHSPEFKEMFAKRIKVSMLPDGTSFLEGAE